MLASKFAPKYYLKILRANSVIEYRSVVEIGDIEGKLDSFIAEDTPVLVDESSEDQS